MCAICYILDTTILIFSLLPLVVFIYLAVCFTLTCAFAYEVCQMRYAKKKPMKWAYCLRKSQQRQSLNSRRNWCKLRIFQKCFFEIQTQKITICSLNVRGLGNKHKRREIFNWLRKKKFSIYFLQEVHNTK